MPDLKKTVLIYPYAQEYKLFAEKIALLDEIEEVILVSPKGWGYEEEKISAGNKTLTVSTEYESNCKRCDEVWFLNTCFSIDESKMILPKIQIAKKYQKKIRNYRTVKADKCTVQKEEKTEVVSGIDVINTPIVLTAGLFDSENISDVELILTEGKIHEDFNVVQIASRREGEALGMRTFPQFMEDTGYTEREKIVLFNCYVKEIELVEKPDIIIIGLPGGVKSYSRDVTGDFGMLFYMVTNAVSVDMVILSVPYYEYEKDDVENIRKFVWEKYRVFVDYIDIMPKWIRAEDSPLANRLLYLTVDDKLVNDRKQKMQHEDIYNVREEKEVRRLQENILGKLLQFGNVKFM